MANPLYSIPGYGGYAARRDAIREEDQQGLQNAGSILTLMNLVQQQKQAASSRDSLVPFLNSLGDDPASQAMKAYGTSNPTALAELLTKKKIEQDMRKDEYKRLGIPAVPTGVPQSTTGQQYGKQPDQAPPNGSPAPTGLPDSYGGITREQAIAMLDSEDKGIATKGKIVNNYFEKRDMLALQAQQREDMLRVAAGLRPAANPAPISQIRVIDDDPKSPTYRKPVIKDGRTGKTLGLDSGLDVGAQGALAGAKAEGKVASAFKTATIQDQMSAVKALKTAGYDPASGEDAISNLIKKSTSGMLQNAGASTLAAINVATEGRKALNTLSAAASQIVMQMMGGKLGSGISNADRDFVMAQLGDIANPNKTAEERLQAWNYAKAKMVGVGLLPETNGNMGSSASPSPPPPPGFQVNK